ncbi:MAG: hypothetical protein H7A43_09735 [Verrucomicrobia bacterium]|nr:hypothetical protein [Verrucomicrobiota bacterium]
MLPVDISFIPERDQLGAVVRQMIAWKRAAPLHDLANLFLAKPELYLLKIEPRSAKAKGGGDGPGTPENPVIFYQTTGDRHLFLQREEAVQHVMGDLLDKVFTVEDVVTEPPAGNFVCVGRCRRTGTLIGPPNYHAFQEGLLQLQQSHFPNLSIDAVRGFIEMVREPEVIEQWRESFRHQKVYKRKDAGEGEAEKTYTRDEACEVIVQQHLAGAIREGNRAILPAVAAPAVTDERLRNTIYAATARERRFPLTMMLALRPAFKRMKLHLFKAGKGETYVTAIPPKPLDADHAIDSIRQMHELLVEHPGWSRKQLAQKIMPDEPLDSEKVVAFLKPLTWLIDKGHVIEFHNGALALPGSHRIDVQSMKTGEPVKGSLPPDEATVATPTAAIAEPATDEPLAAPEPVDEPPAPEVAPRKVGQGDAPTDAEAISSSSPEPNEPTKPDSPAPDEPAS